MALAVEAYVYDMQCTKPIRIFPDKESSVIKQYPEGLEVPCGKCALCKKKKAHEWSMRCLHELSGFEQNVFITLTYDEQHIPEGQSLRKTDLQKFFKRLRKRLEERKIRYFACGEYGDQTQRPHYHAIIFGMGLQYEEQKIIQEAWPLGKVHFGMAEPASIRYVAQYINKKFDGELEKTYYFDNGRENQFKVSSLGIGKNYVDKNAEQIKQQLFCTVQGVKLSLPRYYIERLGLPKELLQQIKDKAMEKEIELLEEITGISDITREQAYMSLNVKENVEIDNKIKDISQNRENHHIGKIKLKRKKL